MNDSNKIDIVEELLELTQQIITDLEKYEEFDTDFSIPLEMAENLKMELLNLIE